MYKKALPSVNAVQSSKMAATISSLLRPFCVSTLLSKYPLQKSNFFSCPSLSPVLSQSHAPSLSSHAPTRSLTPAVSLPQLQPQVHQEKEEEEEEEQQETENGIPLSNDVDVETGDETEEAEIPANEDKKKRSVGNGDKVKLPDLTVKEKKELASYAHGLGKKLKSQLVGKNGVTPALVTSFIETLEANELLKIKIHGTCPAELEDVVKQLEEETGSVVVSQIGRTIIIYRPSITKMKAEEKKREARRIFMRRESKARPLLLKKLQEQRNSTGGRRGSSRF